MKLKERFDMWIGGMAFAQDLKGITTTQEMRYRSWKTIQEFIGITPGANGSLDIWTRDKEIMLEDYKYDRNLWILELPGSLNYGSLARHGGFEGGITTHLVDRKAKMMYQVSLQTRAVKFSKAKEPVEILTFM